MQTLTIKHPFTSTNKIYAGMHWAQRKRIVDEWHELIWLECKAQKIQPIKKYPVFFEYEFEVKNIKDADNTHFTLKMITDGLRYAEIIDDDTLDYFNEYHFKAKKGKEDKVTIYIH